MSLIAVWSEGALAHDPEGEVWIGVPIEGDETAERALAMRGKILEQSIQEQYKRNMMEAARAAAAAFLQKDFTQVVMLLAPYEQHLPRAEMKKLALARKNLGEKA